MAMPAGARWGGGGTRQPAFAATGNNSGLLRSGVQRPDKTQKKPSIAPPGLIIPRGPKFIGGPTQPEMTTFKSVGTDNMVNLFTGDFGYNIPLLDVGGYPVNIYYDGNIGMEQEASWVGLGWNINPGSISRNVRGIPDDFDGSETMTENQAIKPNITVGGSIGADLEVVGIKDFLKLKLGGELGVSVNNYLGPALDEKLKGGVNFTIATKIFPEKKPGTDTMTGNPPGSLNIGFSGSLDLSSRDGATISGSASLSEKLFHSHRSASAGLTASTDYNSRTGIKSLQISGQASYGYYATFKDMAWNETNVIAKQSSFSENIYSTTISFAKPSYVPTIRMPMTNSAWSGHFQLGGSIWGLEGDVEAEVYKQTSQVTNPTVLKPLVGYMYYQNAVANPDAVMDFTRLQDREVTSTTPVISAPQYTYDVFAIQGEGTGGTVRAYRTDFGYVRDNKTGSSDNSIGLGVDIGLPGQYGANFNIIKTPTTIDKWNTGNGLDANLNFQQGKDLHELVFLGNPGESSILDPNAFDKVGGTDLVRYQIGGTSANPSIKTTLQHFYTGGKPMLDQTGISPLVTDAASTQAQSTRHKRSQVVSFLTADEAARAGLDKTINNYQAGLDNTGGNVNTLSYRKIPRIGGYRMGHHISQINVTEVDGKRYVYGIPVYNTTQTDFTFSVKGNTNPDADIFDLGANAADWMSPTSSLVNNTGTNGIDGYYQSTNTPGYAHSFLLSGLLSADYVDVKGDGITEDDLGNAVKFNYSLVSSDGVTPVTHKWRTPIAQPNQTQRANFNGGTRSETKDDKGIVSYGEREQWYVHSIESKTMIAFFALGDREDGKGMAGTDPAVPHSDISGGLLNPGDNTVKLLDHIDLYNKSDVKLHGLVGANAAKPIKTVHFVYSYRLCHGTPDNPTPSDPHFPDDAVTGQKTAGGKLTLESIYFTFNGAQRMKNGLPDLSKLSRYVFSYTNTTGSAAADNPPYEFNGSDRWGTYKSNTPNKEGFANKNFPFTLQPQDDNDQASVGALNANAGAWALKKILLPSGGQIEVTYESDDYAYVQDKRAQQMMEVVGFTNTAPGTTTNNTGVANLYEVPGLGSSPYDNMYVFIRVPQACLSDNDVLQKYLSGLTSVSQLAFKYSVKMKKDEEYLTCYANIATDKDTHAFICGSTVNTAIHNNNIIWLKLKDVDGYSPLTLTALEYLREQLPGQAFPGYDMSSFSGGAVSEIGSLIADQLNGLGQIFADPINSFRRHSMARSIPQLTLQDGSTRLKCFVRLNNPADARNIDGSVKYAGVKYGGGSRVKQIVLKDNWDKMASGQYPSAYGQVYDYTTTEVQSDGLLHTISSGVASYEPSIGGEENPFSSIVQYENRLPLGPASYGSVEMPVLDAFFPAPVIGYSKVTVRSLADQSALTRSQKLKSAIGRQVTQYYTAKDFPVAYGYTPFDGSSNVQEHDASLTKFFHKHAFDSKALSQGFLIITNDMHGKLKSQASYAANDDKTQVNYTENFYKNTGASGNGDQFQFVDGTGNGKITSGYMGIDVELMTDTREFIVKSNSQEFQVQLDLFPVFAALPWLPFPWYVGGSSVGVYRAVTTTKVVNFHSVLDKVVVVDKGSKVSTQNLLRDGTTGGVVVNQTNNEFDQPVYTTSYPAYWAYSGMGPAYQNIDEVYTGVSFINGIMNGTTNPGTLFESGDELLILSASIPNDQCGAAIASLLPSVVTNGVISSPGVDVIWAFDQSKTGSPLTPTTHNFIFIDGAGNPYTNSSVNFRIIRSGKRNLLGENMQAVTNMLVSPIVTNTDNSQSLVLNSSGNIVNASAIEYKEKWQTDNDEIGSFKTVPDGNCGTIEIQDCDPSDLEYHLEKSINPYRKGLLGNFRPDRNLVYYSKRAETDPTIQTNLQKNGFLDNSFALYWNFNNTGGMQPLGSHEQVSTSNWTFKSKTTRVNARGLELETIDALNINTMAQYGFNKTLPVAITNNAGYGEAAYEGFEDNGYDNSLNNSETAPCASTKHIDFSTMGNAQIINTYGQGFNAHTGRYVIAVNPGSTASKTFGVGTIGNTDFNLAYTSKNQQALTIGGWNSYTPTTDPANVNVQVVETSTTDISGVNLTLSMPNPSTSMGNYNFFYSWDSYIYVSTPGSYVFNLGYGDDDNQYPPVNFPNAVDVTVQNDQTKQIVFHESNGFDDYTYHVYNLTINFPCKGIYYIKGLGSGKFYGNGHGNSQPNNVSRLSYSFGGPFDFYSTDNTTNTCAYTVPIFGYPNMFHPTFQIPLGKQMVFSAWVREDGLSASTKTYANNNVQIAFNGANSSTIQIPLSGPVIDGWQRCEAYFTAPAGASTMTLNFTNSFAGGTGKNVYFDDIRIHPFNANMTSYVYDPVTQRLVAQLDANNYASFYEYDEEGTLVRTKAETAQGIKTINETRSAKQKGIQTLQ